MTLNKLLAVRLREMWGRAAQDGPSPEECAIRQKRELDEFVAVWTGALQLPGHGDLVASTSSVIL